MAAVPVYLSILFAIAFASVIVQGDSSNTTQPEIVILNAPFHVIVEKKSPLLLNCSVNTSTTFGKLEYRWRKDGMPLLLDRRVQVFQNGSLFFRRIKHRKRKEKNNVESDEGLYECVAGNTNGRAVARRVRVEVAYIARNFTQEPSPAIAYVGGTARLFCSIKAQPPAIILWQKDNAQAQLSSDDPRFVRLPSGALQVHNVTVSDSGSYRCMAAQNINHLSDQLTSFKWKYSRQAGLTVLPATARDIQLHAVPQNTTAMVGETVILECLADGSPHPNITWRRTGDLKLSDRHSMFGGSNLKIERVHRDDAGIYQCSIKKGGYEQHHSATLNVHTFPLMTTVPESNALAMTRTVSLYCHVEGNPKPSVHWYFNGTPIAMVDKEKIKHELSEDSMKLIVYTVKLENSGYYQCIAENIIGQVFALARIVVFAHKEAPPQPQNVTLTALSGTQLMVKWNQGEVDRPILTFLITYRPREEGRVRENQLMVLGDRRNVTLNELLPYTTYVVTIRSFTKKGSSIQSDSVEGRTLEGVPRAVPSFQVSSLTAETMKVMWDEIPASQRGGVITHYQLQYRPAAHPSAVTTHTINNTKNSPRSFLVKGLTPETKYEVRVAAATQLGYPSKLGAWLDHTTPKRNTSGVPPPELKVDVLNSSAVLLYWELLSVSEGREDDYDIQAIELRRLGDEQTPVSVMVDPPRNKYILTGLENNTDYEVTVYARKQQIQVTHTFRISEGLLVPMASKLRSHAINPSTVRLEWNLWVRDRGIIKYQVCFKEAGLPTPLEEAQCVDSETPFYVLGDLKPFTKYQFGVRIITDDDKHGTFTTLEATTSEDKPGAPVNLTYEVVKAGSVRLMWSPPPQPNGVITSYIIYYNVDSDIPDVFWKNLTRTGQQTIAQVDNLDVKQYFFKMAACTKAGLGNPSNVVVVYPDCVTGIACLPVTDKPVVAAGLSDKEVGISIGVSIGVVCIVICAVVILCRHRCFRTNNSHLSPAHLHSGNVAVYHGNGHVPSGHGNGHAHAPSLGDPSHGVEMLETMPMLTRLPENEMSDAKGGGDMIVTPNGVRMNGFVKTNGHLGNGHVSPAQLDLSTTSEERRSLIEAMLAATNGNAHHNHSQPSDLRQSPTTLSPDNNNLQPEADDSLTAIDHWENTSAGGEPGGNSLPRNNHHNHQGAPVLAGNVGSNGNGRGHMVSAPHFAPFPRRTGADHERPPFRDKAGGGAEREEGRGGAHGTDTPGQLRGPAQHGSTHNAGSREGGEEPDAVGFHPSHPSRPLHPHQGSGSAGAATTVPSAKLSSPQSSSPPPPPLPAPPPQQQPSPPPAGTTHPPSHQHLRKPTSSSSPRQPATSQPRHSPGHRYLATTGTSSSSRQPLPPPPPPPPPPSPPPSPPPRDSSWGLGGEGRGQRPGEGVGEEEEEGSGGESHREGGVTFAPQPSLPQSSLCQQAAAAAASMTAAALAPAAAAAAAQRSGGEWRGGPTRGSPPSSPSTFSSSFSSSTAARPTQHSPPQC